MSRMNELGHPMVTAAFAMTMHKLTGGRFSLGLGRGIAPLFDAYGLPHIKTAEIEDFVDLMRRIWRGEIIVGHDGPAGRAFDVRCVAAAVHSRPAQGVRAPAP